MQKKILKKASILHIYPTLKFKGGAEKLIYQLSESFHLDFNIFIVSDDRKLKFSFAKHYHAYLFNTGALKGLIGFFQLVKIFFKVKPSIVQSHHRKTTALASILKPLFGFRLIHNHHVKLENKNYWKFFPVDLYIAVGEQVSLNLLNYFVIKPTKVKVIPNGVKKADLELKKNCDLKNTAIIVGRLEEQKGHIYLIYAWKEVIERIREAKLIVLGDGSLLDFLIKETEKLNLQNNIIFKGYQDNSLEWMSRSEFVILPSLWEGLPLTILEAFSVRKTVVASNIDGNREIVKNNHTGYIFENKNIKDLAENIIESFLNKEKRTKMEKEAYKLYLDKYTYDLMIEKYNRVYKQFLSTS